jgi:hypothetical protein
MESLDRIVFEGKNHYECMTQAREFAHKLKDPKAQVISLETKHDDRFEYCFKVTLWYWED